MIAKPTRWQRPVRLRTRRNESDRSSRHDMEGGKPDRVSQRVTVWYGESGLNAPTEVR